MSLRPMRTVSNHSKNNKTVKKKKKSNNIHKPAKKRNHPLYGTSKLEEDFAKDFLEKLNVEYVYQYEAKDIGRFYDFFLPKQRVLLEIDGSYFHADPRVVSEADIKPMHKRNKRVDALKDRWALLHGIPIIRIWEKDIRENPSMVMKELKERLHIIDNKNKLLNEKKKRHNNKIK